MTEHIDCFEFEVLTSGSRLDKLVQEQLPDYSRTQIQTLIKEGAITVNGEQIKAGVKLRGGEVVRIELPAISQDTSIEPEEISLNILYEDDDIVVVEKDAGMVVHPGVGNETGTLVHALLARYPQLVDMQDDPALRERMGIAHRLDKDTSGIVIGGLHREALLNLMQQFQERTVDKYYTAFLERTPKTMQGVVDAPIGRDPKKRKSMAVVREGKEAMTEFEVIDNDFREDRALVRLKLLTGRTHQIRVHMAFINAPIVGDRVYGFRKQRTSLKRQFLHASEIAFNHPRTGERLSFTSNLPRGLQNILDKLR